MPGLTRIPKRDPVASRNRQIVGDYIRRHRLALELSQQQLSDLVDGGWWTLFSEVERGQKNLPPQMWGAVARALGEDERAFGVFMLKHTNPWAYDLIFGDDPGLRRELKNVPKGYAPRP